MPISVDWTAHERHLFSDGEPDDLPPDDDSDFWHDVLQEEEDDDD